MRLYYFCFFSNGEQAANPTAVIQAFKAYEETTILKPKYLGMVESSHGTETQKEETDSKKPQSSQYAEVQIKESRSTYKKPLPQLPETDANGVRKTLNKC